MQGKVAVITGASGVLCREMAKALARQGLKVALVGRTREKLEAVQSEIEGFGGVARSYVADVLCKEQLEKIHEEIKNELGACDLLINGAGGNNPKGTTSNEYFAKEDLLDEKVVSFFDLEEQGIKDVFELNYLGTLLPTQVFAQDFIEKGKGNVINISSMNAFKPLTKIPAYSGAKAAVSNLTQWLAVHFANANIRVNAIAPGFFVTEQNRGLLFDGDKPSARAEKILAHTPMGRFGEPEDLIGTLLWLSDDRQSGFVTGVVVPVDGGFSSYSGV